VQFALYTEQNIEASVATPVAATILAGEGLFSRGGCKEYRNAYEDTPEP
jgi:hypothetical protein